MATTKTFKSGNSVAVRFPKSLNVDAGTAVSVREEQGRYIVEPVKPEPRHIDLSGIAGSKPGLKPIVRDADAYDDLPREWHLLGLNGH